MSLLCALRIPLEVNSQFCWKVYHFMLSLAYKDYFCYVKSYFIFTLLTDVIKLYVLKISHRLKMRSFN